MCFSLPAVDLASVLTPEVMAPILANPEVQQRLMPYLPSGESLPQSSEELQNTLSSPQFQQVEEATSRCPPLPCRLLSYLTLVLDFTVSVQAMSMFSSALASGQLGPLMNQFGLPAEAVDAANKGGQCFSLVSKKLTQPLNAVWLPYFS